jgi:hypothetical protein
MINFSELSDKQKKKFMCGFLKWKYSMPIKKWMIVENDRLKELFKTKEKCI